MNITSLSNLSGFNELRRVLRQSPEMLKIRSLEAEVAGITRISHAILEINKNLLITLFNNGFASLIKLGDS